MTKPWTNVAVTTASEMNPNNAAVDPYLEEFYKDLLARLPQLSTRDAIRYTFADAKTADRYRNRGRDEMNARGYPVRTLLRKTDDGACHVYIRPVDTPTKRPASEAKPAPATPIIARIDEATPAPTPKPAAPAPASHWARKLLLNAPPLADTLHELEAGLTKWTQLTEPHQRTIAAALLAYMQRTGVRPTILEYDRVKPVWMPGAQTLISNLGFDGWPALRAGLRKSNES